MRRLLYVLGICALLIGFALKAEVATNGYRDVFIKVNDNLNENDLKLVGVEITARYDGFVTAIVKNGVNNNAIKAVNGVEHVASAITLMTCSDSVRYYSRVDGVHLGNNLDMPYTGKGVIVGVIDCGFDFNHINLCDQDGVTRVKAVYLPLDSTGISPIHDGIKLPGSSYEDPSLIARLTTDDPNTTHGTQTAGIAAGGYRANGWYGIAPDADIVVCGMPEDGLNDVRVANCISYIQDYAKRQGKPCVINISLGSNVGAHDGTSYLNRVCNQLSGSGCVIVVSAGNDGDTPVCVHRTTTNAQDTVTVLVNGFRSNLSKTGYVNAWSKNSKAFNTRLVVVDTRDGSILYRSRALGATIQGVSSTISTETDSVLAQYYTGTVHMNGTIEENGNPSSLCELDMTAASRYYAMGFQYYSPSNIELSIWSSMYAYFRDYGLPWVETGSSMGSISDLATTDSVISVGAYNSRQYLTLRDGSTYHRSGIPPMELSDFTSYGPDENGKTRPDVCAPGSMVIASANRYDTEAPNMYYWQPSVWVGGVEYPYCPDLGTSMSAPVVTGAIALWMEANPNLSAADVRDVLKHSCYRDEYVLTDDAHRWGYGKLDIDAGMRYVLHIEPKNGDVNNDGEITISDVNVLIDIILGGLVDSDTRRRADINNDSEVSISDINALIDILLSI